MSVYRQEGHILGLFAPGGSPIRLATCIFSNEAEITRLDTHAEPQPIFQLYGCGPSVGE